MFIDARACDGQGSSSVGQSAVLYFCGSYNLQLFRPVVQNVWLPVDGSVLVSSAVLAFGGNVISTISHGYINDNQGSAILITGAAQVSLQDNTTVSNNRANAGAGVLALGGSRSVRNSTFDLNSASGSGGAIYCTSNATVSVRDTTFTQNNATYGGAIEAEDTTQVVVHGSVLEGNSGAGGALYMLGFSSAFVSNSVLRNNSSPSVAGAIVIYGNASLVVFDSTVAANSASTIGGALLAFGNATVSVRDTMFTQNNATYGGAIEAEDTTQVVVHGSVLEGNSGAGGALRMSGFSSAFVSNSVLRNNSSPEIGGAIGMSENASLVVFDSTVAANSASTVGGAVALWGHAVAAVGSSTVMHNAAGMDGGAIHLDGAAAIQLSTNTVIASNHAARRGGGVQLNSDRFRWSDVQQDSVYNNTAAVGGQDVSVSVTNVTVMDSGSFTASFNNRTATELAVRVNVSGFYGLPCAGFLVQANLDDQYFVGVAASGENGIANLILNKQAKPGPHNITFFLLEDPLHIAAPVPLNVRSCTVGEVSPPPGDTCQPCPAGLYSVNPANASCDGCPASADCPGGPAIVPEPGFWRSTVRSNQVHRCSNQDACQGDRKALRHYPVPNGSINCATVISGANTYADLQCSNGYHGNLCGLCRFGYGASKPLVCRQCWSQSAIIMVYIISALVMLAFMKLICHFNLLEGGQTTDQPADRPHVTDLLKQLVLYVQYLLVIGSMNIPWPAVLYVPLRAVATIWAPASPETLTVECLFRDSSSVPAAIGRTLFYLCMPLVLLLLLLLLEVTVAACKAIRSSRRSTAASASLVDRLIGSAMVVTFVFIPSVVRTVFGLFACVPLDEPSNEPYCAAAVGQFWAYDMGQRCFEGYHKAWAYGLGLPLLLVLCIAFPIAIVVFTVYNHHRLSSRKFQQHYGFLFRQYRPSCCFWDAAVLLQTALLVAAGVFGSLLGPYYQSLVVTVVLAVVLWLLLVVRPHAHQQTNAVASQCIACLLLTSLIARSMLPSNIHVAFDTHRFESYVAGAGVIVLLVHVAFLASVAWSVYKITSWSQVWAALQAAPQRFTRLLHKCCKGQTADAQQQTLPAGADHALEGACHDAVPSAVRFIDATKPRPPAQSNDIHTAKDEPGQSSVQ